MKEINEMELRSLTGGALPWIVTVLGGALIGAVVSGWSDFKEGVAQGYKNQSGYTLI